MVEQGDAGPHPHNHLAQVDEDRHLEDRLGGEVLELEPVALQQQQKQGREWQNETGGREGNK